MVEVLSVTMEFWQDTWKVRFLATLATFPTRSPQTTLGKWVFLESFNVAWTISEDILLGW